MTDVERDEQRVRDYLRQRADVPVPDDLRWPDTSLRPSRRWPSVMRLGWAPVAAGGLVAGVVGLVGLLLVPQLLRPISPGVPPTATTPAPSSAARHTPDPAFPVEVDGMPVVSVARALELRDAGELDGSAVAVAGYYSQFAPSCPYPGRYVAPLEGWCDMVAFADTPEGARLCRSIDNGMTCGSPAGRALRPFFMPETSLGTALAGRPTHESPAPLVLIGHAGDPRQWQCTAELQDDCAKAFVVDRIAWADGAEVPLTVPETSNQQTGGAIGAPTMTLEEVVAVIDPDHRVIVAAPFRIGDLPLIQPGWSGTGDRIAWLVRSTFPVLPGTQSVTRQEMIWLVDDQYGSVDPPVLLRGDAAAQFARVWLTVTVRDLACCPGDLRASANLQSGGQLVYGGRVIGGGTGGDESTTFGGGYGSLPLVLQPDTYSVSIFLSDDRSCGINVALGPLESIILDAEFPAEGECSFERLPPPGSPS